MLQRSHHRKSPYDHLCSFPSPDIRRPLCHSANGKECNFSKNGSWRESCQDIPTAGSAKNIHASRPNDGVKFKCSFGLYRFGCTYGLPYDVHLPSNFTLNKPDQRINGTINYMKSHSNFKRLLRNVIRSHDETLRLILNQGTREKIMLWKYENEDTEKVERSSWKVFPIYT